MLISQLRCVPVCFYCSISLCRCQYFVVLVCFRRQKVQRLHRCQIFRRYGGNGKFVVLQHPHNGLGPGQSTGVNFQQHKGGVLPDTAHLPIKIAAVCDVVRVVGDVYIAASVGRAQPVGANIGHIVQYRPVVQPITGCRAVGRCKADFLPAARIQQSFCQIRGAAVGQHCLTKARRLLCPG